MKLKQNERPLKMINLKSLVSVGAILFALSACNTTGTTTLANGNTVPTHYGYPDVNFDIRNVPETEFLYPGVVDAIMIPKNQNGAGIVLLASCTGIQQWNQEDLKNFTKELTQKGYTVAVPNYNSGTRPDVRPWNCGRHKALQDMRLVKDVYDATNALANIPGVDSNRIFTIGQSLGAQIGSLAVGKMYVEFAKKNNWGPIPRAVIGLYGGCQYGGGTRVFLAPPSGLNGINRPVLWMSGADDRYYQNNGCSKRTEAEVMKVLPDSKFIVYKDATHCFDCKQLDGFANKREGHTYYYNKTVTKQSRDEIFNFMEKFK